MRERIGEKLLRALSWCEVQAASLFPVESPRVPQMERAVERVTPAHRESIRVLELDTTVREKQKRTGWLPC